MDLTQVDRVAQAALAARVVHPEREPGWLYHHGVRTGKLALWLADELHLDVARDVLYVGALLHDVGKGNEPHAETGAVIARDLLAAHSTAAELDAICDLVRGHDQRRDPDASTPRKLVQDADILDHVGPIGTWLAFYWSGAQGETVAQHAAFILGEENRDDRTRMRANLNYDRASREFDRRIAYEDAFFATFNQVYAEGVWAGGR